jgi:hypothetical protein
VAQPACASAIGELAQPLLVLPHRYVGAVTVHDTVVSLVHPLWAFTL